MAAQVAKAHGCRVVGSAGSGEKVAHLKDAPGLDAALDFFGRVALCGAIAGY